jgi:hypothetical protein
MMNENSRGEWKQNDSIESASINQAQCPVFFGNRNTATPQYQYGNPQTTMVAGREIRAWLYSNSGWLVLGTRQQ